MTSLRLQSQHQALVCNLLLWLLPVGDHFTLIVGYWPCLCFASLMLSIYLWPPLGCNHSNDHHCVFCCYGCCPLAIICLFPVIMFVFWRFLLRSGCGIEDHTQLDAAAGPWWWSLIILYVSVVLEIFWWPLPRVSRNFGNLTKLDVAACLSVVITILLLIITSFPCDSCWESVTAPRILLNSMLQPPLSGDHCTSFAIIVCGDCDCL